MKRMTFRTPGYDCRNAPCQHKEKGDHGISGGYWRFVVVADAGDLALVLTVFGDDYPSTVPADVRPRWVEDRGTRDPTASLDVCSSFPTDREQIGSPGHPCEYLGKPCFSGWSSSLQGGELWKASGQPYQFEPIEALWLALEAKLSKIAPSIRADNADKKWKRCPSCGGTDHPGFVEKTADVPCHACGNPACDGRCEGEG